MENKDFSLTKLLTSKPILCELVKKVEELTKLNQAVLARLEPPLSHHCRVHSYENGILTLSTESPAWGHTLRFSKPDLLSHLRAYPEWAGLKSIRSRVLPPAPEDSPPNPNLHQQAGSKPILSKTEALCLQQAAFSIGSESLRKALLNLAHRAL